MEGHTLPGIKQKSSKKVDLTKKKGLGPRAGHNLPLTEEQQLREHDVEALKDSLLGGKY